MLEKNLNLLEQQNHLIEQGIIAKQANDYKLAEELYNKAISLGELDYLAKAYYNKGVLLDQCLNNKKDALSCYQKAVDINPKYVQAWNNIGNILLSLNNYQKALTAFDETLKLNSDLVLPLINKAYALNRLNKFQESLHILRSLANKAEQSELNNYLFYSELGLALLSTNNVKEAYENFEKAFQLNNNDYQVCYNIAFISDIFKNYDTAISFYDKAIILNESEPKGYQGKACTYIHTKQFEKALPLIQKAIALSPKNFEAYYNLACIYAGLKDKENTLEAIKKTIELCPPQINIKNHIKNDPDFKIFADDSDFIQLNSN